MWQLKMVLDFVFNLLGCDGQAVENSVFRTLSTLQKVIKISGRAYNFTAYGIGTWKKIPTQPQQLEYIRNFQFF